MAAVVSHKKNCQEKENGWDNDNCFDATNNNEFRFLNAKFPLLSFMFTSNTEAKWMAITK